MRQLLDVPYVFLQAPLTKTCRIAHPKMRNIQKDTIACFLLIHEILNIAMGLESS